MNRFQERGARAVAWGPVARGALRRRLDRLCSPWAAALLAAGLLQAPASAQSVTTWAKAIGSFTHCCHGGGGYNSDWVGGTGVQSVSIGQDGFYYAVAIDAETGYGSMEADYLNYARAGVNDVVRASSSTEVQSASADRLVVSSDLLQVGTPISLEVKLSLDLLGSGQATATVGGLPSYFRLDVTDAGTRSRFVNVLLVDSLTVGSVINLDYQFRSLAGSAAGNLGGPDSDPGRAHSALFLEAFCTSCQGFSALLGDAPRVYLAADSGHNYAPIPEQGSWALMLGGLAVMGRLARRRLRGRSGALVAGAFLAVAGAQVQAAETAYRLTEIPVPPCCSTMVGQPYVTALNNQAQVIGGLNDSRIYPLIGDHHFSWSGAEGMLGSPSDRPTGLNNLGQLTVNAGGITPAWSPLTNLAMSGLSYALPMDGVPHPAPGQQVIAETSGLNDSGAIVGRYTVDNGTTPISQRGLLWSSPTASPVEFGSGPSGYDGVKVAGIGNSGLIAGTVFSLMGNANETAAVWEAGQPEDMRVLANPLQPGGACHAIDVNGANQVVGLCQSGTGAQAVLWDAGVDGRAIGSFKAVAMNNHGQVIGVDFLGRAVVWDPDRGMRLLNGLIDPADPLLTSWGVVTLGDINDLGQIAGSGIVPGDPFTPHLLLLTPVPEPGTWVLSMAGLALTGTMALRRRPTAGA